MATQQRVHVESANEIPDPFSLEPQAGHNTLLTVMNTSPEWPPRTAHNTLLAVTSTPPEWPPHTALPRLWNKQHHQEELSQPPVINPYEKWRHDPGVSFPFHAEYQAQREDPYHTYRALPQEYQAQHDNPYYTYRALPQGGARRQAQHLSVHQHHQFDHTRQRANAGSSDSAHTSLDSLQLQPYFRFQHPLGSANVSVASSSTDMTLYPPSELLHMAMSPPKPPPASPEAWSYPRMRLY